MSEPYGQRGRVLAGVILVALLAGSFVWAGATTGDLTESEYPDEVEVTPDRESYVGERVVLGGYVVDTDPVVIATRASGYGRFTLVDADARLENADGPLERNDRVTAFGTLEDESTLAVERAVTRESSETRYMVVASALGGLLCVGWFARHWRFDRRALAFVPRGGDDRSSADDDRRPADRSERRGRSASDGGDRRA